MRYYRTEKSDQETCWDSNRGPFTYQVNALPTEPQVTVHASLSFKLLNLSSDKKKLIKSTHGSIKERDALMKTEKRSKRTDT